MVTSLSSRTRQTSRPGVEACHSVLRCRSGGKGAEGWTRKGLEVHPEAIERDCTETSNSQAVERGSVNLCVN